MQAVAVDDRCQIIESIAVRKEKAFPYGTLVAFAVPQNHICAAGAVIRLFGQRRAGRQAKPMAEGAG